jgi:hypothetical protein
VVGDWTGTGKTTVGVVDPATMTWYLRSSNSAGAPTIAPFRYGAPSWLPVVGHWAGGARSTVGVVDPKTMTWYLRNSNTPGAPDIKPFAFGAAGWAPIPGDWIGSGTTTVGAFDPGAGIWYQRNSNSPGAPDVTPFGYGAPHWTPVAGDWLPTKVLPPHTVSVTSGGSDVTLTTGGLLTLGTGAGEGITAGGATVDINSGGGASEKASSVITASNLRLRGNGAFVLQQGNNFNTVALATTGGPVGVTDTLSLSVGTVNGTSGAVTGGNSLTLTSAGNLTVNQAVNTDAVANSATSLLLIATGSLTANASLTSGGGAALSAGTNLTTNAPINTNGGALVAFAGTSGVGAEVDVNALVSASRATLNGGSGADTFRITPSPSAPITVNAGSPSTVPGDQLFLENLGAAQVATFNITNQVGSSKDGVFTFKTTNGTAAPAALNFTSIESFSQLSIAVGSYQTDANNHFVIFSQLNFNNVALEGQADVTSSGTPPFFVAPNLTNPVAPFSAPQVAVADINGDGVPDVIVGLGSGNQSQITVINGSSIVRIANGGAPLGPSDILTQFLAFDPTFVGGVYVAAGDILHDGSGRAAIVVGAGAGSLPNGQQQVRTFVNTAPPGQVFMTQLTGNPLGSFNPYGDNFTGGVRVAVGDVDGDGHADVITAPGPGGPPQVNVYDGATGNQKYNFMAYDPAFTGGLYIATGNYLGTSRADILVGPGTGATPDVKVFEGIDRAHLTLLADFQAFIPLSVLGTQTPDATSLPGVSSVAFGGRDTSGRLDILVGVGRGGLGAGKKLNPSDPSPNAKRDMGLGFRLAGNDFAHYGPDVATAAFVNFANNPEFLDGIQIGGVVSAPGQ